MSLPQLAAIQMVSTVSLVDNLAAAGRLMRQAVGQGAGLLVLPENFAVFGDASPRAYLASQASGHHSLHEWLAAQARELGTWIVGGSVPWLPDELRTQPITRLYSSCGVYSPAGECVARYNKIHLFDVDVADAHGSYRESAEFLPGSATVVVDAPLGRLGLAICYDLRFPEMFRHLRDQGAEILCLPSAFTRVTGDAHWMPLLRARAIENQCYMIAANQGGRHSESRETHGHSAIISPWGEVLDVLPQGEGVAMAPMDRGFLAACRQRMPVQQHRRRDLF